MTKITITDPDTGASGVLVKTYCREHGLPYNRVYAMLYRGVPLEEVLRRVASASEERYLRHAKMRRVSYRGVEYRSLRALAEALGIKPVSLYYRVCYLGMSIDEAVTVRKYCRGCLEYRGQTYDTLVDLASAQGITYAAVRSAIRRYGFPQGVDRCLDIKAGVPRMKYIIDGAEYPTIKAVQEAFHCCHGVARRLIAAGTASGVELKPRGQGVTYKGVHYPTITAFAEAVGLSRQHARVLLDLEKEDKYDTRG